MKNVYKAYTNQSRTIYLVANSLKEAIALFESKRVNPQEDIINIECSIENVFV